MLRNDLVRIRHILDAAREAIAFCQGRSREGRKPSQDFVFQAPKPLTTPTKGSHRIRNGKLTSCPSWSSW